MYTVYILFSPNSAKTYVGFTTDIERRLFEHNVSANKGFCSRFRPWIVLHTEVFESKTKAMAREKYYKSGVGRENIKKMIEMRYPPQAEKD